MTAARRRKLALAALLALLAIAALLVGAWWLIARPLTGAEQAFVGTWEMRPDAVPFSNRRIVWEFRPDRTCVCRHFDRATGAEFGDAGGAGWPWRLSGGRLVIDYPELPLPRRPWDVLGPRHFAEAFDLTPDGPGRFRFAATQNDRTNPTPMIGALRRDESEAPQ